MKKILLLLVLVALGIAPCWSQQDRYSNISSSQTILVSTEKKDSYPKNAPLTTTPDAPKDIVVHKGEIFYIDVTGLLDSYRSNFNKGNEVNVECSAEVVGEEVGQDGEVHFGDQEVINTKALSQEGTLFQFQAKEQYKGHDKDGNDINTVIRFNVVSKPMIPTDLFDEIYFNVTYCYNIKIIVID